MRDTNQGYNEKIELFFLVCNHLVYKVLVGYPSGQRGQTVNLLAYAFAGSNPAPTTTAKLKAVKLFCPMFTIVFELRNGFDWCAFLLLPSLADFSESMLRKQS